MSVISNKYANKLYCFSPPVMVATFIIEICLALYTFFRYKATSATKLIISLLVLLATFQLAEYFVCRSTSLSVSAWVRLGYMAITLLPVFAVHLIHVMSGRGSKIVIWLAYLSGIFFALFFGLSRTAFLGQVCSGNYVIFNLKEIVANTYYTYYFFWILFGSLEALYFSISVERQQREMLFMQILGFLVFLVPTGVINLINPKSILGIPSIMCGFAILYAFILVFGISPLVLKNKSKT